MWTYWRDGGIEYGHWSGGTPVLRTHFHDEPQLTLVLRGERFFQFESTVVRVAAGHGLYIPAGCPHRGLPERSVDVVCTNLYGPIGLGDQPQLIALPPRDAFHTVSVVAGRLPEDFRGAWLESMAWQPDGFASISEIAAGRRMTREAFTRAFARSHGMAPHAYRLVSRLNVARQRLRDGEVPAAVAADLGYTDQSHLGRQFRQAFGTTPGLYRDSLV